MKLLAVAEELDGEVAVRVHPAMVPVRHPLAAVRDSFNAVFIEGDAVGELMLYGRGAGGVPDRVGGARRPRRRGEEPGRGAQGRHHRHAGREADPRPSTTSSRSSTCMIEVRRPPRRARARSPSEFGDHGVSIRSMQQRGIGDDARLIFVTHKATEADLRATVRRAARRRAGAPRRRGPAGDGRRGMSERGTRPGAASSRRTASTSRSPTPRR